MTVMVTAMPMTGRAARESGTPTIIMPRTILTKSRAWPHFLFPHRFLPQTTHSSDIRIIAAGRLPSGSIDHLAFKRCPMRG